MKRGIKQTIEWYVRTRGAAMLTGQILDTLKRKHSLTQTQAEDILLEWQTQQECTAIRLKQ